MAMGAANSDIDATIPNVQGLGIFITTATTRPQLLLLLLLCASVDARVWGVVEVRVVPVARKQPPLAL